MYLRLDKYSTSFSIGLDAAVLLIRPWLWQQGSFINNPFIMGSVLLWHPDSIREPENLGETQNSCPNTSGTPPLTEQARWRLSELEGFFGPLSGASRPVPVLQRELVHRIDAPGPLLSGVTASWPGQGCLHKSDQTCSGITSVSSLGRSIGKCPKNKLFKGYIELELQLRGIWQMPGFMKSSWNLGQKTVPLGLNLQN